MKEEEYLNSEEFLRDYIAQNGIPNKDDYLPKEQTKHMKKERVHKTQKRLLDVHVDEELDLHGMTVDEAIANLEITIENMEYGGQRSLRIIHGGGAGQYGPVKKYIDRQLNGPLKSKISSIRKEGHNSGATIILLS